jgi:hypothetical protein
MIALRATLSALHVIALAGEYESVSGGLREAVWKGESAP